MAKMHPKLLYGLHRGVEMMHWMKTAYEMDG
jgi:hypothetical protein